MPVPLGSFSEREKHHLLQAFTMRMKYEAYKKVYPGDVS
jgi:hypothetical protein